jgi:hypothetical protein
LAGIMRRLAPKPAEYDSARPLMGTTDPNISLL